MSRDPDQSPTTAEKPWAHNRGGDPRQLLHEADQLDVMSDMRRKDAARLREQAVAADVAADRLAEAARDYRAWAQEKQQ